MFLLERMLAEQAEQTAAISKQQLSSRDVEIQRINQERLATEGRLSELQRVYNQQQDELQRLRITINSLDADKDALQTATDEKTEAIQALRAQMQDRVR